MLILVVNGRSFEGFIHATASKTMTSMCGQFSFQATGSERRQDFPVKEFDNIEVFADDIKLLTGFVEKIDIAYSKEAYTVTVSGREKTADIIDSRLTATFSKTNSVKLLTFVNNVLSAVGLDKRYTVVDESKNEEPFFQRDQQIGGNGESVYDFLRRYTLKKSTVFITNADGNPVIANSGETQNDYSLVNIIGSNKNNIWKATVSYDVTGLFNVYEYRTFADFTDISNRGSSLSQLSDLQGLATDDNIRVGRRYVDIDDEAYTREKLQERALWRMNTQVANSRKYKVSMDGHSFSVNGEKKLIEINQLIKVQDDIAGINEIMLVETTSYSMSAKGNILEITLVKKDAYSLLAEDVILSNAWYQPTGNDVT